MFRLAKWTTILAMLAVGGWLALQAYVASEAASAQMAARLTAALGTRVTVGGLDAGFSGCTITDLAIYEVDAPSEQPPFVTIKRVESDLGLGDIVRGATEPGRLTLTELKLLVRHDRAGQLLTKLPKPRGPDKRLPDLQLIAAGATIQKEGEPDVAFSGIDATVKEVDGKVGLAGAIRDPAWGGIWEIQANASNTGGPATLQLHSAGMHITQAMLRRVPYVTENVWRHVELEGDSPVDVRIILPPAPAPARYRVELSPVNTSVFVPSIDLRASAAAGRVVVEDDLVQLREISGRVAGGELRLPAADLDFRDPKTTLMRYEFDANRMSLKDLPASWQMFPRMRSRIGPLLGGKLLSIDKWKLSGNANLNVRIADHVPSLSGAGTIRVQDISLGLLRLPDYSLKIKADGEGIHFEAP